MVLIHSEPLRIVQTIRGQSTGGDDDRYVASDGSVWVRLPQNYSASTPTVSGPTRQLSNGWLLP
jgi:hypothetical protein